MRRRWLFALMLLSLVGSGIGPAVAVERTGPSPDPPTVAHVPAGPILIEADGRHIVLEWNAPPYQTAAVEVEGRTYRRISMPSCPPAGRPGEPEVPACTAVLGIPPDAPLSLRVLDVESVPLPGGWLLPPIPEPILQEAGPGEPTAGRIVGERYVQGPAYRSDAPFPPQPAALGEPAFLRHQRLVAVSFFPLEYHPLDGRVVYHPRLRLEIALGESREATGEVAEPPEFERLLAHTLLNYAQARAWRRVTPAPLDLPPPPPNPGFRIPVEQEGLYRLTYSSLQQAGLPVDSLDPRTLRLFRYGQEVAIRVLGEEDGRFDPQDAVLFYGRPLSGNRYTDAEVYWLTYGGAAGRRMERRNGTPGGGTVPSSYALTEHLEENHNYYPMMPWRPDHDHWFWNYTYPEGGISAQTYSFPAHPLAEEPYTATLRLHLHGGNRDDDVNPDHHIRVLLNSTLLGDLWWDGRVELTPTWSFSSVLLQPSGNTVRLEAPGDTGAVADWVVYDWLELEERRNFVAEGDQISWEGPAGTWEYHLTDFSEPEIFLLDITDADAPTEIVSATAVPVGPTYSLHFTDAATRTTRYLAVSGGRVRGPASIEPAAPADLRDPANGADYILLTHGDFYTQAQALAAFRAGRGMRARVVDVQDAYDLFAYGRRTPEALHDFLAYAYAHWPPPAPSYVVLLGDGHFDPKDHRGFGLREYILPYLALVDPWFGETAADNRYVCLSGEDLLPDMHLGRLPANSPAEAQMMVNKIVAYESAPPPGDWRQQALFVADNADQAGNFAGLSDALIAGFYPPPYQAQKVYLGVTCAYQNPSVECRGQILSAINGGRLLVNYIGHGGIWLWANERLLDNFALPQLSNAPYLPVVLAMTCYEGMYHWTFLNPNYYSLAETFLRAEGKGWVASWSPTGLGVATGHHYLDEGFFQAVFRDDERRLGPATLAGKLRLWQAGSWQDLLDTYLLLGDPALEMPLLETDLALEKTAYPQSPLHPGDPLTFTLRLSAAGPATAHHVVLTDTLSPRIVSPTVRTAGITLTRRPGTRYIWDVEDLAAGQAGTVTVTAHLSWQSPAGLLVNQAHVSTTAKEADAQNNADTATWLVLPGPPYRITVTASPPALPADGVSLSLIHALVRDTAGNPVADGTPVALATDAGTFLDGRTFYTTTTAQGTAEAFLRAADQVVTATVTVTSGQAVGRVQVPFVSTAPHTVLVEAFPTAIPVTGTAQITATVLDVLGHPVRDGTAVTFTTSLGTVTPTVAATAAGIA
ncbi:MAG: C25 family cysteine peptidase, partial [Chloroflexia bacterium]